MIDMKWELPFVDEHSVLVAAPVMAVWRSLIVRIPRFASGGVLAQLLGAEPRRASGGPLGEGATMPGFRVVRAAPGEVLQLVGRHRFSRYALTLILVEEAQGTTLAAHTHAEFPGWHGRAYRGLVIDSGAHRFIVKRLLREVGRDAEGWAPAKS